MEYIREMILREGDADKILGCPALVYQYIIGLLVAVNKVNNSGAIFIGNTI